MSDEELRELARDESPAGRLKLARALERVGRRDEAIDALIPARADAEVRRALGEYPAWTHIFGDAGDTGFADVRPIRSTPRIAWSVAGVLDAARTETIPYDLVANAFVVVATRTDHSLAGFDAVTGELRWEHAREVRDDGRASLEGDSVIVVEREAIVVLDAWTGVERSRAAVVGLASRWLDGLVVAVEGTNLSAHGLDGARLWVNTLAQLSPADKPGLSRAGSLVLVKTAGHMIALDATAGGVVWERRGSLLCADSRGVLVAAHDFALSMLDLGGKEVLRLVDGELGPVLGPEHIVTFFGGYPGSGRPRPRLVIFQRSSGMRREATPSVWEQSAAALARDVRYVHGPEHVGDREKFEATPALFGLELNGERLWTVPTSVEERDAVYTLAPGHRRLYTLARDGTLTCYTDG